MKKKFAIILFVFAFILIFAFLFFNEYGYLRKIKMNSQLDSLRAEIKYSKKEIKKLKAEIDSLISDPIKLEKVAREKYNFKKPNETVIDIEAR